MFKNFLKNLNICKKCGKGRIVTIAEGVKRCSYCVNEDVVFVSGLYSLNYARKMGKSRLMFDEIFPLTSFSPKTIEILNQNFKCENYYKLYLEEVDGEICPVTVEWMLRGEENGVQYDGRMRVI